MSPNSPLKLRPNLNSGKVQKNKVKYAGKKVKYDKNRTSKLLASIRRDAKKGIYGRGTNIGEETYTYFLKIFEAVSKPSLFFTDRVSMATNVLEETKGKEVHLATNQLGSRVLEAVIGFGSEEHVERFFDVFGEDFRPLCSDISASHILQKLIEVSFLRAVEGCKIENNEEEKPYKKPKVGNVSDWSYNMETKFSKNHKMKCESFMERFSNFILKNLEDFISDRTANHLIRTCIYSLAGIFVPKAAGARGLRNKFWAQKQALFKTPKAWQNILIEFSSRLEMLPQLPELVYNSLTSPLLGVICKSLAAVSEPHLIRFGQKLLKGAFLNDEAAKNGSKYKKQTNKYSKSTYDKESGSDEDEDTGKDKHDSDSDDEEKENESGSDKDEDGAEAFPAVFTNFYSVFLLEDLISAAGPKLFNDIFESLFSGRISALVMTKRGSNAVKALLRHMSDKSLYETIFEELVSQFDKLMDIGNRSLFDALAETCMRLNTKQAAFLTAVQEVLHCSTAHGEDRPKSFLNCLLKFKQFEDAESENNEYASVVGSFVTQNMLKFNKPIFLVNCILEAYPRDFVNIILTPPGSFVADAFVKNKLIGEKFHEKFVRLLDGFYMELALSNCGSRVLQNVFDVANDSQKLRIAKELTSKNNKLKSTIYGRITYNKLRLEIYKLNPEEWKASWNAKEKPGDDLNGQKGKKRTASISEEENKNTLVVSPKKGKKKTESFSEETNQDTFNKSMKTPKKGKKNADSISKEANGRATPNVTQPNKLAVSPKKGKKKIESLSDETNEDTLNQSMKKTPKKGKNANGTATPAKKKRASIASVQNSAIKKK